MKNNTFDYLSAIYASENIERVRLVVHALRDLGVDVWLGFDQLIPGQKE